MGEDWDNLFILDACRYDMFADRIDLAGSLESRISLGSSSEEFMERNFVGEQFHDTVYINANPFIPRLNLDEDTFHAVVDCLGRLGRGVRDDSAGYRLAGSPQGIRTIS